MLLYKGTGYDPGGLVYSKTTQQVCFVSHAFDDPYDFMWSDLHVVWSCIQASLVQGSLSWTPGILGLAMAIISLRRVRELQDGRMKR
jgi:hypothetical protein